MEKVKQAVWPFLGGCAVGAIALSTVFGFVSNGTANERSATAAEDAAVAALVPYCVAAAEADSAGRETILAESSFRQRDALGDAGWVSYPDGANRDLQRAINQGCLDAIKAL